MSYLLIVESVSKKAKKKLLFTEDIARMQTCVTTLGKFNELRYELFCYPQYSPDIIPPSISCFKALRHDSSEKDLAPI